MLIIDITRETKEAKKMSRHSLYNYHFHFMFLIVARSSVNPIKMMSTAKKNSIVSSSFLSFFCIAIFSISTYCVCTGFHITKRNFRHGKIRYGIIWASTIVLSKCHVNRAIPAKVTSGLWIHWLKICSTTAVFCGDENVTSAQPSTMVFRFRRPFLGHSIHFGCESRCPFSQFNSIWTMHSYRTVCPIVLTWWRQLPLQQMMWPAGQCSKRNMGDFCGIVAWQRKRCTQRQRISICYVVILMCYVDR